MMTVTEQKPDHSIMQMIAKDDKDMKKLLGDDEDNPDDYFDAVTIDGI